MDKSAVLKLGREKESAYLTAHYLAIRNTVGLNDSDRLDLASEYSLASDTFDAVCTAYYKAFEEWKAAGFPE